MEKLVKRRAVWKSESGGKALPSLNDLGRADIDDGFCLSRGKISKAVGKGGGPEGKKGNKNKRNGNKSDKFHAFTPYDRMINCVEGRHSERINMKNK